MHNFIFHLPIRKHVKYKNLISVIIDTCLWWPDDSGNK